jgi:hypothetical protein
MSGIGSLVTFQSLLPGVLETGGRTIQAALDVYKKQRGNISSHTDADWNNSQPGG